MCGAGGVIYLLFVTDKIQQVKLHPALSHLISRDIELFYINQTFKTNFKANKRFVKMEIFVQWLRLGCVAELSLVIWSLCTISIQYSSQA